MIAAIYARKSNEQNGVADEAKSCTRQVEHAKAYALKKGWQIADQHIYIDDGISGIEFAKRPAFVRLMNAVACRPVDVVVCWNFRHIVRLDKIRLFNEVNAVLGYRALAIHSPREVTTYEKDETDSSG